MISPRADCCPLAPSKLSETDYRRSMARLEQREDLNAPRIKPEDIKANIASEFYFTAADGVAGVSSHRPEGVREGIALSLLTFCVLVLKNGFTVTGESACASPENFDAELGRNIARENAVEKLWPLMGYELKTRLYQKEQEKKDEN